jgi:hypothetical protein
MVHVHGAQVQRLVEQTRGVPPQQLLVVPIDVGKHQAMALVGDFTGEQLAGPFRFPMTRAGVAELVGRVRRVRARRPVRPVRVGIEAAGHYHCPLVSGGVLPAAWQLVQLNPVHVSAQRRVNGQRGVKTDPVDLAAICDLLVAGRGVPHTATDPTMGKLAALVAHRDRWVQVRTATKNQLLGQADRCFPGLSGCLSSLLDTKVGRLLLAEFPDPARLARLGARRLQAFAAHRGVSVRADLAERLVDAARQALPTDQAAVARRVLADDLALLARLEGQVAAIDQQLEGLLPTTPVAVLTSVAGWATTRVGVSPEGWTPGSCGVGLLVCGDPLVGDGAVVAERGVPPAVVVERDPGEHHQPCLLDAGPAAAELALEGGEEALGDRVVQRVADAAHRLDHPVVVAQLGEGR